MRERDLILIGGGHTHALAIRALAMQPIDKVRVTLISEQTLTPYSGMLPGFVAGHYTHEETHIDLNRLCQWASVRYLRGRVYRIDPINKSVHVECDDSSGCFTCAYDIVSLDIGSTPDTTVTGAGEFAVGVKPVSRFAATWNDLLEKTHQLDSASWGVIGAGAGGVELVLAMAHRVNKLCYHLVYPQTHVLPGYPSKLVRIVERQLARSGVILHPNFRVERVESDGLYAQDGEMLKLDQSIWCTGASAAAWLKDSGLQMSERGFIAVDENLRSFSHPDVFAVGDCADMLHDPRPKAGVYAVRQAPYLVENLRQTFQQGKGRAVNLQKDFLSLISLGAKSAVGCRNGFVASGRWVWRLKDHIDRKFMLRLNDPGDKRSMINSEEMPMHCAGCGSKLGPDLLRSSLCGLPVYQNASVIPALGSAEDASLWRPDSSRITAQSIDGFRSFSSDHWRFGKICVNHALSDLYAMGAKPISAQVWINLAFAHPRLQKRDHRLLMSGVAQALREQETVLAGGHSTEGMEDHIAVVANGELAEGKLWKKNTPRAGDVLLLTKSIGTGVVLAADMHARASSMAVDAAFDSMLQSNREAAILLGDYHPSAVTDVTGFGVLGHLLEMIKGEKQTLGATIDVQQIPLLPGVLSLAECGVRSTLFPQLQPMLHQCKIEKNTDLHRLDLLLDPQTSGGLLIALPVHEASEFIGRYTGSAVAIGHISEAPGPVNIRQVAVRV